MFSNFLEKAPQFIEANPLFAYGAVFLGGLMTAANPCVLASIPLVIGFIGGGKKHGVGKAFLLSATFAIGLTITFVIMGLVAGLAGTLFGNVGDLWKYIVGAVCVLMGVHLLGLFKLNIPAPKFMQTKATGYIAALLFGMMFGLVSSPCAAPILVIILAFIASKGSVIYGGSLLLTYSLAHCTLILVAGTSIGAAQKLLDSKGLAQTNLWLKRIGGVLIALVGIYIVFG